MLTEITGIFHRALLGRMASLIILGVGLATAPNVCAQIGIASHYPNDKGLAATLTCFSLTILSPIHQPANWNQSGRKQRALRAYASRPRAGITLLAGRGLK